MQKICLIVNPISGGKDKKQLVQTILEHLDHQKYTAEVAWTQHAGHGTVLARSADADIVVAVGGDGTVSEVGQGLAGTGKALGIIPCGSGDGLALHLGIPRDPVKAVQILNTGDISPMDMARVNDRPFFCTTGVGFDAVVAWSFAQAGHRGLWTYIREAWKAWWSFQPEHYDLDIDGTRWSGRAFLITVGNCNQWGNQARITPEASVNDGLLEAHDRQRLPLPPRDHAAGADGDHPPGKRGTCAFRRRPLHLREGDFHRPGEGGPARSSSAREEYLTCRPVL